MSKLIVLQWPLPRGVAACSPTCIGNVSLSPHNSFNLGAYCGDNPDYVEGNCKRFFAAGNPSSKLVWLEQVHGKDVLKLVGEPYTSERADASYSNAPGTVYAVMTADCLPVLFYNRAGTEVTAAHAGWHGLCTGVLKEAISYFANSPEDILAWLGSTAGPRVFEVGVEVHEAFTAVNTKASTAFIQHGGKYLVGIYPLARQRLVSADVEQTFGGDRRTYTESETLFSHRRDKTIGHMANFIWLI